MDGSRRIFWGHTLGQALARAARHYALPAERLAYRVHEKRHGFVRHPRAVLVEVDPGSPELLTAGAGTSAPAAPPPAPATEKAERRPTQAQVRPTPSAFENRTPRRAEQRPSAGRRSGAAPARFSGPPPFDEPNEDSVFAAAEAARRIVGFARLELEPRVQQVEDRLEVELAGADTDRLRRLGLEFLDEIESLLPRAILSLSGLRVRCRVDGAGLRGERESELRARAREVAGQVVASGEAELIGPLNPAERRTIHVELAEFSGVRTESVGDGHMKRLRIVPGDHPSG
jgi:hypothetical protein